MVSKIEFVTFPYFNNESKFPQEESEIIYAPTSLSNLQAHFICNLNRTITNTNVRKTFYFLHVDIVATHRITRGHNFNSSF